MAAKRIAVLDDYANVATPQFQSIPDLSIDLYPDTLNPSKPDDLAALIERLKPYEIISSMRERTPFPATLLRELPNLKLLLTTGMRNLGIDMQAAKDLNIVVTGTKGERPANADGNSDRELPPPNGYSTVIQHTWALLLGLCSRVAEDDRALKTVAGAWQSGLMISLAGKTLGIVGLGKLGVKFAKIGIESFGMRVVAWSQNLTQEKADAAAAEVGLGKGVFRAVSKGELLRTADVVSLHNVLSERSRGMIGTEEIRAMKRKAILLNTSRGALIDEEALIQALKEGQLGGFVTDVFWEEPLSADSPWRRVDEWSKTPTLMSPHMAYVNEGSISRWYQEQAEILKLWYDQGEVLNKLN